MKFFLHAFSERPEAYSSLTENIEVHTDLEKLLYEFKPTSIVPKKQALTEFQVAAVENSPTQGSREEVRMMPRF